MVMYLDIDTTTLINHPDYEGYLRLSAAAPHLLRAAKQLIEKLEEYAKQGLDVPGEVLDLEAAVLEADPEYDHGENRYHR